MDEDRIRNTWFMGRLPKGSGSRQPVLLNSQSEIVTSSEVVIDSYSESSQNDSFSLFNGSTTAYYGQTFTNVTATTANTCKFYLKKTGSPTGNLTAKIYAMTGTIGVNGKPTGAALATSDVFNSASLTTSYQLITFTFSGVNAVALSANTNYVLVLDGSAVGNISNYVQIGVISNNLNDVLVPHWSDGLSVGNIDNSTNWQEMSGLTAPQLSANSPYLWVVSDSPANMIAAVSATDASNKGVLTLTGQTAMIDLEDIESRKVNGICYLYGMDFGNNGNGADSRGSGIDLRIFRIVEPIITGSNISTTNFIEINCAFPAGNLPVSKDCEACIVDENGKIWIITKRDVVQKVYSLAHALTYSGTQTLVFEGNMTAIAASRTVALTTTDCYAVDAAMSPNGKEILVKSYSNIYYFARNPLTQTVIQALQGTATAVPAYTGGGTLPTPKTSHPNAEPQGEGICFSFDGRDLYSTSEYVDTEGSTATSYPLFKYARASAVPTTAIFQDGVSPTAGYVGTTTTYIQASTPSTDRSAEVTYVVDFGTAGSNPNDDRRGLLKFDLTSIPTTATVVGAKLEQWIAAEGQGWKVYKMLVTWNGSSTHTSLSGVNNDGVKANVIESYHNGINLDGITALSVRDNLLVADVQAMVSTPSTNFGWLLKGLDESVGSDGVQFESKAATTASHRPKLTVRYI